MASRFLGGGGQGWRAGLFDQLMPQSQMPGFEMGAQDKDAAVKRGLLALAAGIQSSPNLGIGLTQGLLGGYDSLGESRDQVVNDRYRQAMMQRTMAGMDHNTRVEELSRQAVQNGQINPQTYAELASYDPERAKALRDAIEGRQTRWQMGRIGDGQGGEVDVLFDPMDPSQIRTIDGQPINGGQSSGGLLGAVSPGLGAPDIGILKPEQVQQQYTQLASAFPGAQISSRVRSPEHNKAVGGVPNSQHIRGTAADFVVPASSRPDFIQRAKSMGFQALDEGDHVHLELPNARRGAQMQSQLGLGRRPAKAAQDRQPTDLERRMALAQQMGASQEEIKRLVLGQSAPSKNDAIGGKALTAGTVEKMTKNAERMRNLTDLQSSFKDTYAGNLLGNLENLGGRLGNIQAYAMLPAATPGQTEWWQQYDREKNVIRNELFGAALTASEAAAFDQADINPRMDPKIIKANLKKQRDIIERGLQRQGKVWAAQGYNRAAIDAAIGSDSEDVGMPGIDDIVSKYGAR